MKKIALLASVLLCGCSVLGLDDTVEAGLHSEKSAWLSLGAHNYAYTYQKQCFCMMVDPVRITVAGDTIISVTYTDDNGAVVSLPKTGYYTIPALYDYLISVAGHAAELQVQYDHTNHLPAHVSADLAKNAIDDEFVITTGDFQKQ